MTTVQSETAWKLVPVEATAEMVAPAVRHALSVSIGPEYPWPQYMFDLYKIMLDATPPPPSTEVGELVERIQCFHDPDEPPGNDCYLGKEGDGFIDRALAVRLSYHVAMRIVGLWNNPSLQSQAAALAEATRERNEAFRANEHDRAVVSEVRGTFLAALARRSWLLEGRGSYEWDDDRWKAEFGEAVKELGEAIQPLEKIGIDWSLCPVGPDEIAEARIDWKSRADSAEAKLKVAEEALRKLRRMYDSPIADEALATIGATE